MPVSVANLTWAIPHVRFPSQETLGFLKLARKAKWDRRVKGDRALHYLTHFKDKSPSNIPDQGHLCFLFLVVWSCSFWTCLHFCIWELVRSVLYFIGL